MFTGGAKRANALLDWATVSTKMPWGPVILLGGGYALADGMQVSRLMEISKQASK